MTNDIKKCCKKYIKLNKSMDDLKPYYECYPKCGVKIVPKKNKC